MAESVSSIDDAIAHLDALISRLQSSSNPAAAPSNPPPEPPRAEPASVEARKEEVVEVKKAKETGPTDADGPIPDIFAGRKHKLKLPGAGAAKTTSTGGGNEHTDNFDKALIQVALVQSVDDHPISEKLYICKVDVGSGNVKQVVAGLKKFVKVEELEGKKVCVILNLKPAKLAGQLSEAMILAGSVATQEGSEIVKVLEPPSEAVPGDRIFLEGGAPSSSPAKQLSSKIWETIVYLLKVEGGLAVFDSKSLVTSSGSVKVPGLPDGAAIH